MLPYLFVALGSALGGVARFWVGGWIAQRFGESFPANTLFVNVTGSFLIGLIAMLTGPDSRLLVAPNARIFMTIGVLGGYTTFSSFSLQTLNLAREGDWLAAAINVGASVVLCLVAVWLGHVCAEWLNR
jgi:CrcB protein